MTKEELRALTDEQVAALALSDERAFEEIVRRFTGPVGTVIGKLTHDSSEVDDLRQDVWIKMWNGLKGYDATRPFSPWLFTIAANVSNSFLRKRQTREGVEAASLSDVPDSALRPAERLPEYELGVIAENIEKALKQLPARLAIYIRETFINGLSEKQLAAKLGIPVGTVKSRLHHARQMFKTAYRELEGDAPLPPPFTPDGGSYRQDSFFGAAA